MAPTAAEQETPHERLQWVAQGKPEDAASLEAFLASKRPSQTAGGDDAYWIWVQAQPGAKTKEISSKQITAMKTGLAELEKATKAIEQINSDSTLPLRQSKAKGMSKKQWRDREQKNLVDTLRELAMVNDFTMGKWMFFVEEKAVDILWSLVARGLLSGKLSKLSKNHIGTAKISAADHANLDSFKPEEGRSKWCLCIYFRNCFDRNDAEQVFRAIVEDTGQVPSACKSDFYTYLDISSKHPSGIRSSNFTAREVMQSEEIEELKSRSGPNAKVEVAAKANEEQFTDDEDGIDSEDKGKGKEKDRKKSLKNVWPKKPKEMWPDSQECDSAGASKAAPLSLASSSKQPVSTAKSEVSDMPQVVQIKKPLPQQKKEKPTSRQKEDKSVPPETVEAQVETETETETDSDVELPSKPAPAAVQKPAVPTKRPDPPVPIARRVDPAWKKRRRDGADDF